jgi:hypothetical protein
MPHRNDDRMGLWEGAPGRADPDRSSRGRMAPYGPKLPGPYGRQWGSPDYGEPLTQAQMDREANERAIRARNRSAGQGDPAFDYERPQAPGPPWTGPLDELADRPQDQPWELADRPQDQPWELADRPQDQPWIDQYSQYRERERRVPQDGAGLMASGQRARAIAREAFAARQRAQQPQRAPSQQEVRRGGRPGRPASHPGGRRRGFRLGDLLGGLTGRAFSRGGMLSRVPRAALVGAVPQVAQWLGSRR